MTAAGLLEAITKLERMPARAAVRLALAEAEFRLAIAPETGPEEAVAHLRRAAAHDPYLPKVYLHLGRLLHRDGKYRDALVEYRQAVRLAPASRRAHLLMALALLELGRFERIIGQQLIGALDRGDAAQLRAAVDRLDSLAAEQATVATDQQAGKVKAERSTVDGTAAAPDTWQAGLYEQLARDKPAREQVAAYLRMGAELIGGDGAGVTEYATACSVLLTCGEKPASVRKDMVRAGLDVMTDHPAAVLLTAVLELAEAGSPEEFVRAATGRLRAGHLPPALVCWLHFARYGPGGALPAAEAIRLLNAYPEQLRDLDCFTELRLAVLDAYAGEAWRAGRYAQARLLWRETVPLDSYRVPVALNLALLAARMRSVEDYPAAWERLVELLYLSAAGTGDVQTFLEERRMLHLALSHQGMRRHCGTSPPSSARPEELTAWLSDRDALDAWLREWDLYYLNSRLRFRSPVHLLGAPSTATAEQLRAERDALLTLLDQALGPASWAGARTFVELARARVGEAYEQALDPVARADDPYRLVEEPEAKALAGEVLERAALLYRLMCALAEDNGAVSLPLACSIARREHALPRALVRRTAVEHGRLSHDAEWDIADEVDAVLGYLAGKSYSASVAVEAERERMLTGLEECAATLPQRADIAFCRCELLVLTGRGEQAYLHAVAALGKPAGVADGQVRARLVQLVDAIALDEIPEAAFRPTNLVQLDNTVAAARRALLLFPRSHRVRLFLAEALLARPGGAGEGEAAEVLADGLPVALTEEQQAELDERLAAISAAAPVVRRRIREQMDRALASVQRALDDLRAEPTPEHLRAAHEALDSGLVELSHARELARAAELENEVSGVDSALSRLARLESQLDEEAQ